MNLDKGRDDAIRLPFPPSAYASPAAPEAPLSAPFLPPPRSSDPSSAHIPSSAALYNWYNAQYREREKIRLLHEGWSDHIVMASSVVLLVAYLYEAFRDGLDGVILLTLSIAPVVLALSILRMFTLMSSLPIGIFLEMFWLGAIVSVGLATVLEMMSQMQTRSIWRCQLGPPSLPCDTKFILVVIVGVGFVEELSKCAPLCRMKTDQSREATWLFSQHPWFFRIAASPHAFVTAGLASAAGFACLENVKYVFAAPGLFTSCARAILSIPFHMGATTIAACHMAQRILARPCYLPPPVPGDSLVTPVGLSPWDASASLVTPSILHGLYDAGLFIATQLATASGNEPPEAAMTWRFLLHSSCPGNLAVTTSDPASVATSETREALYTAGIIASLIVSFVCNLVTFVLAVVLWRSLPVSPLDGTPLKWIPAVTEHSDADLPLPLGAEPPEPRLPYVRHAELRDPQLA